MNLKELAYPIRLYWDLTPVPDIAPLDHLAICREIAEMRFFALNLRDAGAELSSSCIEILETLKNEPVAIALTVSRSAVTASVIDRLSGLKVKELLVDAFTEDDLCFIAELLRQNKDSGMVIGASLQVNRDNYMDIPELVSYCIEHDINRIVFPMQRLIEKEGCFYIGTQEGKALTEKILQLKTDKLGITIHDPLLWKIFYPDAAFPGAGCQAGNSMAYISPVGNVYPCPSMPLVLGDIKEASLRTILSSVYKKELVKSLRKPPEECLECGEVDQCSGGCRGRTIALKDSAELRDPACA